MQTLSVLAVEDGAIILASPAGERFRLPVDAALRARITSPIVASDEKRLSPREIQAHVRAGLTADQVAAMTGVPVGFIERFVGPVLAELAYIVESALAVRLPPETDGARSRTFGAVMEAIKRGARMAFAKRHACDGFSLHQSKTTSKARSTGNNVGCPISPDGFLSGDVGNTLHRTGNSPPLAPPLIFTKTW